MLADKIQIYFDKNISRCDLKILSLGYLPIIGSISFSIYLGLYNLVSSNNNFLFSRVYNKSFLCDLLNLNEKEFDLNRQKLEGIGLLINYYDKVNKLYTYKLVRPVNDYNFFNGSILDENLKSQVGNKNYQEIFNLFNFDKLSDFSNLENKTKLYNEVYDFKIDSLKIKNKDLKKPDIKGINFKFDFDKFLSLLPRKYVTVDLYNEKYINLLSKIMLAYNFDLEKLANVYVDACGENKICQVEELKLKAFLEYDNLKNQVKVDDNIDENDLASYLEKVDPFAVAIHFKADMTGLDRSNILDFISKNEYSYGLQNAVIMFCLKNTKLDYINSKYLETIINSWYKNGIRTAKDAIKYMEKINQKYAKKSRVRDGAFREEWLDDYLKELEGVK